MKRPTGIVCAAVVCALLGLQAGAGSASAQVRGEPVAVAPAGAATDEVTELPQVSGVASGNADAAGSGARVATVPAVAERGPRHDYNRDGRSDMVAWYDYSDGSDAMHTFAAGSDGSLSGPLKGWEATEGSYWAEHMKYVTGDFNGDGTGDVAAFYGYDDGKVSLFTWLGKGDGTFGDRLTSWTVDPGNWTFDAVTAEAGDFDGDGRDDIAAWYDYRNGDDKLFTFLARPDGGFASPFSSFARTAADGWDVGRMKFATGDYDGDGRDDLGVLYGYASGTVTLMSFTGEPGGGFAEPVRGWESTTGWTFSRMTVHSGDFDGDGRDSIAAWYDYADGHDALIGFDLDVEGKFGNRREILNRPAGWYERSRMKIVTGDYNGDGRDDLATVYGYTDLRLGTVKTITFTAQADGTLAGDLHGWETEAGWTFDRMRLIERHSEGLPICPTVFGHGGYPTEAKGWERDQIRQPNHPKGLAQQKSWGAAGVEADLQLTKDGTKGVMWHNKSTRGLTGPYADANAIWWATGADQLKGRTIDQGPYKGETVYTFREWLDSAKSQNMAAFVELKGEAGPSLLNNDASIRETAWNEVIAPIKERIASQQIMIYTESDNVDLKAELEKRIEAAGLGAALRNHPRWVDGIGWEEPAPAASGNYATWLNRLSRYGLPTTSVPMVTTWPKELKSWLSGRCV
ncbi:FG-GAP-like repeat-containing protein [Streptomyces sp. NPDC127036]|uniref:FG-GAP-like repeat-containing protein n=1 Tax=unclassified Streptomyces TaxID=2593676 RepID=UPI0036627DE6